jgi:hypothetical protein
MSGELYTQALEENRTIEERKKRKKFVNLMLDDIVKECEKNEIK